MPETNLVPNPRPWNDLYAWEPAEGASGFVDPLWPTGGASVRLVNDHAEAWQAVLRLHDGASGAFQVAPGDTLYAAVRVKAMQRCRAQLYVEARTAGRAHMTDLARDPSSDLRLLALDERVLMVSCGVPPGTSQVVLVVVMHPDWEVTDVMDVGAAMLVTEAVVMRNRIPVAGGFDGDTVGCWWNGPRLRSPSVRPASTAREMLPGSGAVLTPAAVGFPAFTADSPWNREAGGWPVHPDSDAMIEFVRTHSREDGALRLEGLPSYDDAQWGMPMYVADTTSPRYRVSATRYPLPPQFADLRIPAGARPTMSSDAELVVYDLERGTVAYLWQARHDPARDRWSAAGGSLAYLDGTGVRGDLPGGDPRNPGGSHHGKNGHMMAWRWDEVVAGTINRAVRVGLSSTATRQTWLWPFADHSDGLSTDPHAIPWGARLRLRGETPTDHLGAVERVLAQALRTHGLVVADCTGRDGGTEVKLEDTTISRGVRTWPLHPHSLPLAISDFEVVLDPLAP